MMNTKISIIVPVYNVENDLEKCIQSLIDQTYRNLEIILINDGSTDKSGIICDNYKIKDNRITVIHKHNQGLSHTRNVGLDRATGNYICFVDGDDWIALDMIEKLYFLIRKYNCDVSQCGTVEYTQKEDINTIQLEHTELYYENEDVLKKYFELGSISAWNKLFKKELIGDNRYVVGVISEDIEGTFDFIKNAKSYVVTTEKKYYYNQTTTSISRSVLKVKDFYCIKAANNVYENVKKQFPYAQKEAELHIYKAIFNIINKGIINGCENKDTENIYITNIKEYKRILRKNINKILLSAYFSRNDKLQILILSLSYNLFKKIKKLTIHI